MKDYNNAAIRENVCSEIYNIGVEIKKREKLSILGDDLSRLHEECYLHIHDLDTFGDIYNCSMPNLKEYLLTGIFNLKEKSCVITELFSRQKKLITELGMSQSGGIGFNNYDVVISDILEMYGVQVNSSNIEVIKYNIKDFLQWINTTKTRCCREPYYLTLNIGLATTEWGRIIVEILLDAFYDMPIEYTRPNIVFKVITNLHLKQDAPNTFLLDRAIRCTGRRMIPTYFLMDSEVNNSFNPEDIGIMGCRTRVAANINGKDGSNGRGNIGNVSINLPRIALESESEEIFFEKLHFFMEQAIKILKIRSKLLMETEGKYITFVVDNKLWNNIDSSKEMIEQGTISVGYIGLSEAVEILSGKKFFADEEAYALAIEIISFMRAFLDKLSYEEQLNYSLLASPGEMISGRFCEFDKEKYEHEVHQKGFYTNSFHVDVDSKLSVFEKIEREAPFHQLNNGGSITYVELKEAISHNYLAVKDIICFAMKKNISYLGINYPLDICRKCGFVGTFDNCLCCGSNDIKRIRRVSGYLEDLEYFTKGKKAEVKKRKINL